MDLDVEFFRFGLGIFINWRGYLKRREGTPYWGSLSFCCLGVAIIP